MSTYETKKARSEAANRAFYAFMDAYADAIGEKPAIDDPETKAARRLAAEAFGFFTAYPVTDDERATVSAMVEAIADAARFMRPFAIASAAADRLCEAYDATTGNLTAAAYDAAQVVARAEIAGCHATDTDYAWVRQMVEAIADRAREAAAFARCQTADAAAARFCAALTEATGVIPYVEDAASVCKVARDDIAHESRSTALDRDAVDLMTEAIAEAARKAAAAKANQAETAADPEDLEEPAPIYQRYELLAYLGEPEDYDVDAIEAEATAYTADGAQVWTAFGDDLAAIAERHELYSYAPAI